MFSLEKDLAIDMGTSSTLIFEQGRGVIQREPTVVAVDKYSGKIQKVGTEAQKMLGRTPANIVALKPVEAGTISDYEMAALMLRDLLKRSTSSSFLKPRVLACVPSSVSGVEERAVMDSAIEAGARSVYLLETAIATAVGAGVDITQPNGHLIIDIGGGTTEIAVISSGGVVECESIETAGTSFDEAIVRYVRRKHNMLIGLSAAEEIKRNIGCALVKQDVLTEEVKGRNLVNGLPKTVSLTSAEVKDALVEPINKILEAVHIVIERTPPQLVADLDSNGIILSGGGCQIAGLDSVIARSTNIRTNIVEDPTACAVYGAGKLLKNLDNMQSGMMNFCRRRQLKG